MIKITRKCDHDGCSNPHFAKGFCKWHQYLRADYKKPEAKRTKIAPKSKKQIALDKAYSVLRRKFMSDPSNQFCPVMKALGKGNVPATDVHHKKGRGKYMLDVSTWMAVSREGHVYIHDNPEESYKRGWMLKSNSD